MPELLPLRHGRMVKSAFTFYRGAALTMAADLAATPATELWYQAMEVPELIAGLSPALRQRVQKRIKKEQAKSRGEELFPKLAEQRGNLHVIKDQHAPRVEPGPEARLLRPPVAGHEDRPDGGDLRPGRDGDLRHLVRPGPRPRARAIRKGTVEAVFEEEE
jgi:hypothetical protein